MVSLKGKRIFIVEDNLHNRQIMQMSLAQTEAIISFDIWGAQTVIHLLARWPVDLVLLDLMFPRTLSGYDIFDKSRAESRFSRVPIVAVSASDISSAVPKCKAKGFAGFIPKPIDIETFPDRLIRVLQGEEVWAVEH